MLDALQVRAGQSEASLVRLRLWEERSGAESLVNKTAPSVYKAVCLRARNVVLHKRCIEKDLLIKFTRRKSRSRLTGLFYTSFGSDNGCLSVSWPRRAEKVPAADVYIVVTLQELPFVWRILWQRLRTRSVTVVEQGNPRRIYNGEFVV